MRYIPIGGFYDSTGKMGTAIITSKDALLNVLGAGHGSSSDKKCNNEWDGILVLDDGTKMKVSCWDWHGSSEQATGPHVSIWCEKGYLLGEWINFLKSL